MKVLGKTKEGAIIEVTQEEAANLAGIYLMFSGDERAKWEVGATWDIGLMYKEARETLAAYASASKQFEDAQRALGRLAAQLAVSNPKKK